MGRGLEVEEDGGVKSVGWAGRGARRAVGQSLTTLLRLSHPALIIKASGIKSPAVPRVSQWQHVASPSPPSHPPIPQHPAAPRPKQVRPPISSAFDSDTT
ncbi:unnamed protein product, partial [Iphiclides podalirius]